MWSLLSENDLAQSDGCSFLYAMAESGFDTACKECLDFMTSLPVKLNRFHLLCCCPGGTSEGDFLEGPVKDAVKMLEPLVQEKVVVHVCASRTEFAGKLNAHGLAYDSLPKAFGGKWWLEDFLQWQELRILHEWDVPMKPGARSVAVRYFALSSATRPTSSLTADERAERKQRMNLIRARRKRHRTRIETVVLEERCVELRVEQTKLLREGDELQKLIQHAAKTVVNGI
jgi:hypothetical protein